MISPAFVMLNLFQHNKRSSRVILERSDREVKQVQDDEELL
jgi:hypothetical protein